MSLTTDKIQAMPMLEQTSDNAGVPLHRVLQGDALAAKNALAALIAKDAAGNLRYPKVNANDELIVDTDSNEFAYLHDTGKVTGHASVEQIVLEIALVAGREYRHLNWIVSNFRNTEYRIVHVDDPSGTPVIVELATVLVGPGDLTDSGEIETAFIAPSTAPVLRIMGINKDVASDLRATLSVLEVV